MNPPCPCCGRPPTYEYRVERDKCRLWQQLYELKHRPDDTAIGDCMRATSARIVELKAALAETAERANAAQASLRRHHGRQTMPRAETQTAEMFRDGARIEMT